MSYDPESCRCRGAECYCAEIREAQEKAGESREAFLEMCKRYLTIKVGRFYDCQLIPGVLNIKVKVSLLCNEEVISQDEAFVE